LKLGCPEIPKYLQALTPFDRLLPFGLKFAGRYIPVGGAISTGNAGVRMQSI
jgi:hypothetical protein